MLLTEQQKIVLEALISSKIESLEVKQLPITLRSLKRKGLIDELSQPTEKAHRLYHRLMSRRSL